MSSNLLFCLSNTSKPKETQFTVIENRQAEHFREAGTSKHWLVLLIVAALCRMTKSM